MKRIFIFLVTLMLVSGMSISAYATLIDMLDGTIYDDDRQLTWLKDANYAKTSNYDADGLMAWVNANTWANGLVFATFDNWRLPTALNQDGTGPCSGLNCTGSEIGLSVLHRAGESIRWPVNEIW